MKLFKSLFSLFGILSLFAFVNGVVNAQEVTVQPTPTIEQKSDTTDTVEYSKGKVYIAKVIEAEKLKKISYADLSNTQLLEIELESKSKLGLRIETSLSFPNPQFKYPLKVGDRILIESDNDLTSNSQVALIGFYRQNNLLVLSFILIGLFTLLAGFKTNIKYFKIFIITLISGAIALYFYHKNTYITFVGIFVWQLLATTVFSYQIFKKRFPAILLSLSVLINLLLAIGIVFILQSINLFDSGFFDLFVASRLKARPLMIFLFPLLLIYPISVILAEQIISESIKKKRDDNDILKINLIRHVTKIGIRTLNNIFLTFFGLFFAIFVCTLAIASQEGVQFTVLNSASLSQIISVGFLILFNLMVFIPLVSFITGMWLGSFDTHELVTDRNVRQLEL
jgi:hypothetical protein